MRILSGAWAGVSLASPGGRVRPTTEELRGAWMGWLAADLPGARVLDLFAGTGALGLEALSRGAAAADFVENGPPALHALKANIARLRVKDRTRLFKRDVFAFLESGPDPLYDIAFADPPYTSGLGARLAALWLERPFSRILSIEHAPESVLPKGGTRRVLGENAVTVYGTAEPRRKGPGAKPGGGQPLRSDSPRVDPPRAHTFRNNQSRADQSHTDQSRGNEPRALTPPPNHTRNNPPRKSPPRVDPPAVPPDILIPLITPMTMTGSAPTCPI